ncbi:MAG: DUF177 domain-containing protein [bacterium]|nr:DUF177 domain-containing protein [bacterium]
MLIDLAKIMSVKGKVEQIEAPLELDMFELDGVSYPFKEKNPVRLTITHLGERKVKVDSETTVSLNIPCNRCLDDVETFFDIHVSKELDFNDTDEDRIKELDEANYISGYSLDVDKLICDELVIDFPLHVLCKEDCKGLCKACGANLNHETCGCDDTVLDPRMSVIRDIFNNFKEV